MTLDQFMEFGLKLQSAGRGKAVLILSPKQPVQGDQNLMDVIVSGDVIFLEGEYK